MVGWLVPARLIENPSAVLELQLSQKLSIPSQSGIGNKSDEAIWLFDGRPHTLHEVNDPRYVDTPRAHVLNTDGVLETIPSLHLQYRITDVTAPDEDGLMWAINYQWSGDRRLRARRDEIQERWGFGRTHAQQVGRRVERLVALRQTAHGIVADERAPILLRLDGPDRNWEGIARHRDGFLLITDTYPETIFAYVPAPDTHRDN
ncbi:MAG: hypothetical protein AAFV53_13420 [Myxococcota bacterium]